MSTFGTASSSAAAVRTSAEEGRLWSSTPTWQTFGDESLNFGHQGERVASTGNLQKDFHAASAFAMLGLEGRQLGFGSGSRHAFVTGTTEVAAIRWVGNTISITLAGSSIASHSLGGSYSDTTYYTLEFAFGTSGGFVVCETRLNGARIAALTTTGFIAGTGQSAGSMSAAIAAAGTAMTGVIYNHGNQGSPLWYYVWTKNHSAVWDSLVTAPGTTFAQQSDFVGIKKKYMLVPNALGAYTITGAGSGTQTAAWTLNSGSATTHYSNLADAPIDNTLYVQSTVDGGGVDTATNKISHGFTNLPAAATRVGWVQHTCWATAFQATNGVLARSGVRSGAGDSPASTDFMDTSLAQSPNFGVANYTPGTVQGGGTKTTSVYYPQQGTLAQFTTGGTSVWSVTTVNAIESVFQTVDIV